MGCAKAVETVVGDTLATVTGNPELIPLINAGISVANGGGLKGALIAGGEALAGQELAGAVGIGQGNSVFNNAFGITGDNPAGTGLPDIGKFFSDTFGGGSSGASSDSAIGSSGSDAIGSNKLGFSASGVATPVTGQSSSGGIFGADGQSLTATPSGAASGMPTAGGGTISPSSVGSFGASSISNSLSGNLDASGQIAQGLNPGGDFTSLGSLNLPGDAALGIQATGADAIGSVRPSDVFGTDIGQFGNLKSAKALADGSSFLPTRAEVGSTLLRGALPLAAVGFEAAKGPAKLPSQASALEAGGAATAPLLAMETAGANEAASGQLTPTQQANIEQGVQQQENQLIQQLASQGITNPTKSSQYQHGMRQIQQWALAQQQGYITQAISEATSAGGAASGNIATVANEQIQLDKDYQDALAAAFGALGGGPFSVASKTAA